MTTLPRLLAAMALRSLATAVSQRLDPIAHTLVGAVGYATEGRWDVDALLAVPDAVGEVGAEASGVVAGCGCDHDVAWFCNAHRGEHEPERCPCACHEAVGWLRQAAVDVHDARSNVSMARGSLALAREAIAARPKPEADDIDDDDDWQDYGVTAPGGAA